MKKLLYIFSMIGLCALASCELDDVTDPNNPDLGSVASGASEAELNALATGILAGIRDNYDLYVTSTGTVARELYLFDADPRNVEDLLGAQGSIIDNNTFYITGPYNARYQVVKTANILLDAIENTDLVTEEQKNGYSAFANTMKAYQLLLVLNMLGPDNGIRIDVNDPDNLGPFVTGDDAYAAIASILDEAASTLSSSPTSFAFPMPGFDGINGFNDADGFLTFNRALAARVAAYRENWDGVLTALDNSFFELNGPLRRGPAMVFSTGSGDMLNPLYKAPGNSGDMIYAHPTFVPDALPGDERVLVDNCREINGIITCEESSSQNYKLRLVDDGPTISVSGLTGRYEIDLYDSPTDPIIIIRNEELVLLYAEAQIQLGNVGEAVDALNVIRNEYGLDDYDGPTAQEALIEELLYQRRYSLWAEGHRFVDLRRYNRLNSNYLPIDREGDQIFTEFPIPLTEAVSN